MTATDQSAPVKSFSDLGVDERVVAALREQGITIPFAIQELTLPLALSGADLIGQARTGTGKTLAFGIPLLERVDEAASRTQALVVVPTRELCLQVHDDLVLAGAHMDVSIVAAYGGKAIDPQSEAIAKGAAVVVGTPGRLLDLMRRRALDLSTVTTLVLDEADEMLDLGFLPDVEQLVQATASDRQTLLFSATMPSAVVALARRYMRKPTFLRADVEEVAVGPATRQHFFSCHRMDKPAVLARILQAPQRGLCLVFTRTKRMADTLAEELRGRGIPAAPIHSDLRQDARERALSRFRKGTIDVLVATEVAARGLDIDDVTHVVNYDCPDDERMYLHRIGRTGRAGAAGVAITLAVWNELARLDMIKRALDIDEPTHEVFSTSPILDELFDLPRRDLRPARVVTPADGATSRKGRRGRPERAAPPRKAKPPREAAAGSTSSAADEPAASAEPEAETAQPNRVETASPASTRRIRRRSRAVAEPDRAPAAPAPSDDEQATDREADGRRERRTRTRGRAGARPSQPADGARDEGGDGTDTQGSRGDASGAEVAAQRASAEGGPKARPSTPRPRKGRVNRPGRSTGGVGRREAASPRSAQDRAEVEQARGNGKPAHQRPLRIAHLP